MAAIRRCPARDLVRRRSVRRGLASLVAIVVTAALVFSWRYFEAVGSLFHVLVLVFLAAMAGFALTGDLFNLFVFFELMSVAAYALTGHRIEEAAPLQGALDLAVTNAIGGFLILIGVALVYGRTGTLNMAEAGRVLAEHGSDRLVVVAFVAMLAGFLTKGAAAPFHFWLADAHAVAPTPVCAIFSGVMVELALYGFARVYWVVFSGPLGAHAHALRAILIAAGVVTAAVGATMCVAQRHLKRLLAFSTVAHEGSILIGVGLLGPAALAGTTVSVLSHAFTKAALFLAAGIILHRFHSVDEGALRGRGAELRVTGVVFVAGGLALAGLPPFGTWLGDGITGGAASDAGLPWVASVLAAISIVTGGAIVRSGIGIFTRWGARERRPPEALLPSEEQETRGAPSRTPTVMLAPALVFVLAALLVGVWPRLGDAAERRAAAFEDRPAYASMVLGSGAPGPVEARATPKLPSPWEPSELARGGLTAVGALLVAWIGLVADRARGWTRTLARLGMVPVHRLRALHSGHVGDYVAWMTVGIVVLGGAFAFTLR